MFIFTKKPVHIINYLYALFLNPLLSGYPSCSHTHTHLQGFVPHKGPFISLDTAYSLTLWAPWN